jgi:NADPH:quinone reductase
VIDPVGGPLSETALRALRFAGRFVTLGYASGEIPRIPLNLVLLKGVEIRGLDLRTYGVNLPARARGDAEGLAKLVANGLRPRIGAVFALREVAAALSAVAARRSVGKVVLAMPETSG